MNKEKWKTVFQEHSPEFLCQARSQLLALLEPSEYLYYYWTCSFAVMVGIETYLIAAGQTIHLKPGWTVMLAVAVLQTRGSVQLVQMQMFVQRLVSTEAARKAMEIVRTKTFPVADLRIISIFSLRDKNCNNSTNRNSKFYAKYWWMQQSISLHPTQIQQSVVEGAFKHNGEYCWSVLLRL